MTMMLPIRLLTAIPAAISEIAAQAAYILDPDIGGALTYTDAYAYACEIDGETYYRADLPIWTIPIWTPWA
jgi:hypothetical protein